MLSKWKDFSIFFSLKTFKLRCVNNMLVFFGDFQAIATWIFTLNSAIYSLSSVLQVIFVSRLKCLNRYFFSKSALVCMENWLKWTILTNLKPNLNPLSWQMNRLKNTQLKISIFRSLLKRNKKIFLFNFLFQVSVFNFHPKIKTFEINCSTSEKEIEWVREKENQ